MLCPMPVRGKDPPQVQPSGCHHRVRWPPSRYLHRRRRRRRRRRRLRRLPHGSKEAIYNIIYPGLSLPRVLVLLGRSTSVRHLSTLDGSNPCKLCWRPHSIIMARKFSGATFLLEDFLTYLLLVPQLLPHHHQSPQSWRKHVD